MRKLNAKQKRLLDEAIHEYMNDFGKAPIGVESIHPIVWEEIEAANDYERMYQDSERYIHDQILKTTLTINYEE